MVIRSIAFVTPWPPNVMGIGETCYAFVKRLAEISPWHFSVYTNALNPIQIPGVSVHTLPFDAHGFIDVGAALPNLRRHDLVVHQMGNSSLHAFQWPLLHALPSVCHFHDLVYYHFWSWYYFDFVKNPSMFFSELCRFYPDLKDIFGENWIDAPLWCRIKWKWLRIWNRTDLNRYPLFEPHVEKSIGCIVHSEYSKSVIQKAFPSRVIYKIPLHKGEFSPCNKEALSNELHFGIFGSIMPNKQVDLIFQTFATLNEKFPNWKITLVGPIAESCKSLYGLVKKLGIENKVKFLGKVEKDVYLNQLSQIDCCINLRFPSYGESSGVVTECLILGIPVLVINHMWYSELPTFFDKLDPGDLPNQLLSTLYSYFLYPQKLAQKKALSKEYSDHHFSYLQWAKNYLNILEEFCLRKDIL